MTKGKYRSLIVLCLIIFSAMRCKGISVNKNASHQKIFTDLGEWTSSNILNTESIAGPESSLSSIPGQKKIAIPGQGDSFDALGIIWQASPDYVVAVNNLQWNGVIRQAWFQQHYQLQHTFFDPYDSIAPVAIYALKPSPFDTGENISVTHTITGDAPRISAYRISTNWLRPGRSLYLTLTWESASVVFTDLVNLTLTLYSEKENTTIYTLEDRFHPIFETFFDSTYSKTYHTFVLPSEIAAGEYSLRMALSQENGAPYPVKSSTGEQLDFLTLLQLERPALIGFQEIIPPYPTLYDFLENDRTMMTLTGFDMVTQTTPGIPLHVDLVWHALETPAGDYTVFVHLRDAQNNVLAQADNKPVNWTFPTDQWQAGQYILDEHIVLLPEDVPRGNYSLYIGLYDAQSGQRLPVFHASSDRLEGNEIRLSPVVIR